jgi:hypothetical protein
MRVTFLDHLGYSGVDGAKVTIRTVRGDDVAEAENVVQGIYDLIIRVLARVERCERIDRNV